MREDVYGAPVPEDLLDVPGVVGARRWDRQQPSAHPGLVLLDAAAGEQARVAARNTWVVMWQRWDGGPAPDLRVVQVQDLSRDKIQTLMSPITQSSLEGSIGQHIVTAYPLTQPRCMVIELRAGTPSDQASAAQAAAQNRRSSESAGFPLLVVVGYLHSDRLLR